MSITVASAAGWAVKAIATALVSYGIGVGIEQIIDNLDKNGWKTDTFKNEIGKKTQLNQVGNRTELNAEDYVNNNVQNANRPITNWLETKEGKKELEAIKNHVTANEAAADKSMNREAETAKNLEAAKEKYGWDEMDYVGTPPIQNEEEKEQPLPPISGMDSTIPGNPNQEQGAIQDTTDNNLGTSNIATLDWMKWAEDQQMKRWEREDQIRKETQVREDTAWQRGIEDMRKSGVNVNLIGAQPAESGGGITQATGQDLTPLTNQMQIDLDKIQQIIDNEFKGNENDKDRFMQVFSQILQVFLLKSVIKGGSGK